MGNTRDGLKMEYDELWSRILGYETSLRRKVGSYFRIGTPAKDGHLPESRPPHRQKGIMKTNKVFDPSIIRWSKYVYVKRQVGWRRAPVLSMKLSSAWMDALANITHHFRASLQLFLYIFLGEPSSWGYRRAGILKFEHKWSNGRFMSSLTPSTLDKDQSPQKNRIMALENGRQYV